MKLPTREECEGILNNYRVPIKVRNHSFLVNKIANFLAKKLKEKNIDINIEIVDIASLLHDLTKGVEFRNLNDIDEDELAKIKELKGKYPYTHHEEVAYLELKNKYPEIARVIRVHGVRSVNDLNTWEDKIVNYADKLALEKEIVNLDDRFKDLEKRYDFKFNENIIERYYEIEKEILGIININYGDLVKKI